MYAQVAGHAGGCIAVRNGGGAARIHALLRAWVTARASAGATALLPHLLLLLITLAEGAEEAKQALVRAGCVETRIIYMCMHACMHA